MDKTEYMDKKMSTNYKQKEIFETILEGKEHQICSICLDKMMIEDESTTKFMQIFFDKTKKFHKPIYTTHCNHAFHGECLLHYNVKCKNENSINTLGTNDMYGIPCPNCRELIYSIKSYSHYNIDNPCCFKIMSL